MSMEPMDVGPKYGGHLPITEVDRQQALTLIEVAQAQGYLTHDEYEHRALAIRSATLYDDLRPVTRDLSNVTYTPAVVQAPASAAAVASTPSSQVRVGFFSGSKLTGRWTAPSALHLIAVFGGVEIDLRDAVWTSDEIVVDAYAVFGGIEVKVPDGVEVVEHTIPIFGGTSVKRTASEPTGRRVVVRGLAAFGGIEIKGPKPPRE